MSITHASRSAPHPINLHLEFFRRTSVGQATYRVKDIKLGSRISNLHIILAQADDQGKMQDEVEGYITMSNIGKETGLTLPTRFELHPAPTAVDLSTLLAHGEDQNWGLRLQQAFPKFRRVGKNLLMHLEKQDRRPADRSRAILDQWVRFSPLERPGKWTNDCLGFVVDMFPQIVESYVNAERGESDLEEKRPGESNPRPKFWYPTLALNLDVKKLLPEEGVEWLFVRVQATVIKNGRIDLRVTVLDESGDVVALSTHCSLIMDANRNTTRNSKKQKESKL
jgi:hypothetical protein